MDLGIEVILELFSKERLTDVFSTIPNNPSTNSQRIHALQDDYIKTIITNVLENGLPEGISLNVNFPAVKKEEIKGIKICRQAKGRWEEEFDERLDPHKREYFWLTGMFKNADPEEDTDTWALANNYVSVVPVQYDFTGHKAISAIKRWKMNV